MTDVLGNGDGLHTLAKYANYYWSDTRTEAANVVGTVQGFRDNHMTNTDIIGEITGGSGPYKTGGNDDWEYHMIEKPENITDTSTHWVNLLKWIWRFKSFGNYTTEADTNAEDIILYFDADVTTNQSNPSEGSNLSLETYIKELTWDTGATPHPYDAEYRGTTYLPHFDTNIQGSPLNTSDYSFYNPTRGTLVSYDGDPTTIYVRDPNPIGGATNLTQSAEHYIARFRAMEPGNNIWYVRGENNVGHLGFMFGTMIQYTTHTLIRIPNSNYNGWNFYAQTKYVEIGGYASKSNNPPASFGFSEYENDPRTVTITDMDCGDFTLKKKVIEITHSNSTLDLTGTTSTYAGKTEDAPICTYISEPENINPTFFGTSY